MRVLDRRCAWKPARHSRTYRLNRRRPRRIGVVETCDPLCNSGYHDGRRIPGVQRRPLRSRGPSFRRRKTDYTAECSTAPTTWACVWLVAPPPAHEDGCQGGSVACPRKALVRPLLTLHPKRWLLGLSGGLDAPAAQCELQAPPSRFLGELSRVASAWAGARQLSSVRGCSSVGGHP